jgi:hypothetical protein
MNELMEELATVIPGWNPELKYSTFTSQWYVSAPNVFARDKALNGDVSVGEHKNTPEEAIEAAIAQLKNAEFFYTLRASERNKNVQYAHKFYRWDADVSKFKSIERISGYTASGDEFETEFASSNELLKRLYAQIELHADNPIIHVQSLSITEKECEQFQVEIPQNLKRNESQKHDVWLVNFTLSNEAQYFFLGYTLEETLSKALISLLKGDSPIKFLLNN